MNHLPSTNQYAYLGIPFNEALNLESIIAKMNIKIIKKFTLLLFL